MNSPTSWYIIKLEDGSCAIRSQDQLDAQNTDAQNTDLERWGPYPTPEAAIAKRVGLIRAGKCRPQ